MNRRICNSNVRISSVKGREIIDSRGNPTVEVEVFLSDGSTGTGRVPSGASTGAFEAIELRDSDKKRFGGKGVEKAVSHVNKAIAEVLHDKSPYNSTCVDKTIIRTDKSTNKGDIGANAILGTSMAVFNASSESLGLPLYRYIGGVNAQKLPLPMMNIINGGAHAANTIDSQEFMIVPVGAKSFKEGLRWCTEVYHCLKAILKRRGLSTAVGDEGGFAPDLKNEEEAIDVIIEAIKDAGYEAGTGKDFMISLDVAASEWKSDKNANDANGGSYHLPKQDIYHTTESLIEKWENMTQKYPIFSIEDPLDEEDWHGWQLLTARIGHDVILVGDDLFVTNTSRLRKGIEQGCGNAILIKPNQIGSVTETIEAVNLAKENGFKTIMSHRSGETEDTFIADLAVGLNTGYIKTGAPCRGERTAKYNRLVKIEEEITCSDINV